MENYQSGFIPSPAAPVLMLGSISLSLYVMTVVVSVVLGTWIASRRWVSRGGLAGEVVDAAMWVLPFGIIGARLYHVLTCFGTYFGPNGKGLVASLQIWHGGLGLWGAILGGALGGIIFCRRNKILIAPLADASVVGLAVAQAVMRFGNYFDQQIFGQPTTLPWGLEIDVVNRPPGYEQYSTFHPTFLYEALWCLLAAGIVVWADKKFTMGHGRVVALYLAIYCLGRLPIEMLRIDPATIILGLRVNLIPTLLLAVASVVYIIISAKKSPGREMVLRRTA